MKIVFDARTIRSGMTGVGIYSRSLLQGLARVDSENKYRCLFLEADQAAALQLPENFRSELVNADYEAHPAGEFWLHFSLPKLLTRWNADIFHGPAFTIPWRGHCRRVVTIHDLTVFVHPETYPLKFRSYMRWVIRNSVKNSHGIIAVSNSTRNDLLRILRAPDKRIRVVLEAAGGSFQKIEKDKVAAGLQQLKLKPDYILFVGTLEPRKGVLTLLEAYSRLSAEIRARHPLLLVGRPGWKSTPLTAAVERAKAAGGVMHLDYIDPATLPLLYNGAALLAYPSLYEGFGLPPLEAMACGTPVICANSSSLPEVVGAAGILCAPGDVSEWTRGLTRLLTNAHDRDRMAGLGLARAREFSWEQAARQTLELYRAVNSSG